MVKKPTTRDMSDAHEIFLAELLDGRRAKGSGNQFNDQMDGRNGHHTHAFPFAWDGKSTFGNSIGVSREMWTKALEQSHGEIPMLALRWYSDYRLKPLQDLVVIDAHRFAEILEAARKMSAIADSSCLTGTHIFIGSSACEVCGTDGYEVG